VRDCSSSVSITPSLVGVDSLLPVTKDNDTVAAIVGAAVGALHGRAGLPARWIDNLLGRTTASDDGHIFRLLEATRRKWWSAQ
jgi:hypothetical protein